MGSLRRFLVLTIAAPLVLCSACSSNDAGGETDSGASASGSATDSESSGGPAPGSSSAAGSSGTTASASDSAPGDSSGDPTSETSDETGTPDPVIPELSPGCGMPFTEDWLSEFTVSWGEVSRSAFDPNDGSPREFLIELPENYDPDTPYPIIFTFHGQGSLMEAAYGERVGELWDYQAITIYPQSATAGWNLNPNGEDFGHVIAILNEVGNRMCVDMTRVFTRGTSRGGMMSNALACGLSDIVDGSGISAARFTARPSSCVGPSPVWIMHGTGDSTIPFSAGEQVRDNWIALNGCSDETTPIEGTPCVTYTCTDAPLVWCAHEGGHDIPATQGLDGELNAFLRSL